VIGRARGGDGGSTRERGRSGTCWAIIGRHNSRCWGVLRGRFLVLWLVRPLVGEGGLGGPRPLRRLLSQQEKKRLEVEDEHKFGVCHEGRE